NGHERSIFFHTVDLEGGTEHGLGHEIINLHAIQSALEDSQRAGGEATVRTRGGSVRFHPAELKVLLQRINAAWEASARRNHSDADIKKAYDILGVRLRDSYETIRSAYRKRARECHPDVRPGDP